MHRKITPQQARHINHLVNVKRLKLREVVQQFPQYAVLSLTQIHRIATGKNWSHETGTVHIQSTTSLEKVNR